MAVTRDDRWHSQPAEDETLEWSPGTGLPRPGTVGGPSPEDPTVQERRFTPPPTPPRQPVDPQQPGPRPSAPAFGHPAAHGRPAPAAPPHTGQYPGPPTGGWAHQPAAPAPKGPTRNPLLQKLSDHRWLVGGAAAAVVVAVAAVAITVAVQSDDSASDETTAPTTVAQVPAGPTTALPAPAPAPSAAPPTPPAAPAPAPPSAASGPILNPDALSALLLPADQISQLMNTPGMSALPVETQLLPGTITPPQCTGVWGPVYVGTYTGTGYTGLAVQGIQRDNAYKVAQAVVSFPDPGAAKATYDRLLGDWNACQNMTFNFSYQSQGAELQSGAVHPIGDIATIMLAPTTDTTIAWKQCERGMTLRGNVIVDVRACSPSLGSASYAITTAIAANIH